MSKKFFFNSETPPLEDGPDDNIDLLNDETFGSGAVQDNWEVEHNQFAELHSPSLTLGGLRAGLDEDALELSNRQLAAAVEELVLNSDQDQDAIDPAIVSLRKESRPGSYDPRLTENLISPYLSERESFSQSTPSLSSQTSSSSLFQSDGMKNIWSSTDAEVQDSFLSKSPSMVLERQHLNEKLKHMMQKKAESPPFEDAAILSAVKTSSSSVNWPMAPQPHDHLPHMFPHKHGMLRAEDIEREFTSSQLRGPSPTFGISIPKDKSNDESFDRSLPARSISPVFGSPSSHAMPIGTPPKHIAEMMHQQILRNRPPMPHPNMPMPRPMTTPPRGIFGPPHPGMPPPPGGMMIPPRPWPPQNMNRPPMNPVIAQDIMKRLGISGNNQFPMMSASPPTNLSPIGSPRFVQAPRMAPHPNVGFGRPIRGGPNQMPPGFSGPQRPPGPFPQNRRFAGPPQPLIYLGPGHLHPEHSRFVRMRRQQNNRNRHYGGHHGNSNHRGHGRDQSNDHQSYLMSNREKEWVIKIQMMALQSDRPEIDDYYYQHYIEKRLREGGLSLNEEGSEQKRLITPTKANPDNKKYVPVQFNNSLGKLTVSSVYNPRQIIDVVHADKEDDSSSETVDSKMSMNKRLEIYKVVEKTYSVVMMLEELHSSLTSEEDLSEGARKQKMQKIEDDGKVLEDLLLNSGASKESSSTDAISQILKIRKGKRLVCRALPFLSKNRSLTVILVLLRQLPILIKRDQKEDILQEMYKPVSKVLQETDSDSLSQVCTALAPNLSVICKDKFGLSLVCRVLSTGHTLPDLSEKASDNGKTWDNYVTSALSTLMTLVGKGDNMLPDLLDKRLGDQVVPLLDRHFELLGAGEKVGAEITPSRLKVIKQILTSQYGDSDTDTEILGTKRLSPEV